MSANWATRKQENNRDHWSLSHQGRWGWATSDIALSQETSTREGKATPAQTDIYGAQTRNQEHRIRRQTGGAHRP